MGFAGLDCSDYPGDLVMEDLVRSTNLAWCGFYLAPAPSHRDPSWMDRRSFLIDAGWGLAPIYVGQQESGPGSHRVTGAQGKLDGDNACALAAQAGFPRSTVIYLDVETAGPVSPSAGSYVKAWINAVAAQDYTPGVYCSHTSVASIAALGVEPRCWVYRFRNADVGVDKQPPFKQDEPPSGELGAVVAWQWAQDCHIATVAGPLQVDLDTAAVRDPSQA